ncbi:hypothetical protein GE09DRAFT_1260300 [Coniochaeta sp. 2T2.1]|nr:hypothetical protein GE09DRAFT_1260300 [Coniochaeta sp. 2T2.1]
MAPTSARRTASRFLDHYDPIPLSESPWRPMPGAELSQVPWRWSKSPDASPPPSPPRPPCPTRPPPPIPTVSHPDMSATEKSLDPAIHSNVIAALMASLESAKDINNLRQNAQPGGKDPTATAQSPDPVPDQFGDLYSPPPSLQKIYTHHSHHSSKHSAGHSHAFNGGRSHKASVASSGSTSRELMTTEERMSEADEFFAMGYDDDGGHGLGTVSIATTYGAGETPVGSTLDAFGQLVKEPSKRMEDWM